MDINEEFNQLQDKYLKARAESDKCLTDLYIFLKKYLLGFLKRYAAKKNFYVCDIEEKTEDAALFFINQYLSKPNWKVERFTAYYGNALLKILHGESEQNWDNLKKTITQLHVNQNEYDINILDEIDKQDQEQKEYEEAKKNKQIQTLHYRWVQQSFNFGE